MSFDEWMLALHVLGAFALVAGLILFWVLIIIVRRADTPDAILRLGPVTGIANAVIGVGMGGTIALGIWLALSYGGYDIWDPWIVAALVLWLVAAQLGRRADVAYVPSVRKARELRETGHLGPSDELRALNRGSRGVVLQVLVSLVVLAIIVDMIWKPGA